jgi:hypothetical protein
MKKFKVNLIIPTTSIRIIEVEGNSKQEVINNLKDNYINLPYIEETIIVNDKDGEIINIEEIEITNLD